MKSFMVTFLSLFLLLGVIACDDNEGEDRDSLVSELSCTPLSESEFIAGLGLSSTETYMILSISLSDTNFLLQDAVEAANVDDVLLKLLTLAKESNQEIPISIQANLSSAEAMELARRKMTIFEGLNSFSEGPSRVEELNALNTDYEMTFEVGCEEARLTSKSKTLVPERSEVRSFKLIDDRSFYTSFENLEAGRELPLEHEFNFTYIIKMDTDRILVPPVIGQLFVNVTQSDFARVQSSSRVVDFFPLAELSLDYIYQRVLANQQIGNLVYQEEQGSGTFNEVIQQFLAPQRARVLFLGESQR